MTAFISSAWGLVSASANLVIGTKQMSERARRFLDADGRENISAQDRAMLLALQSRVEIVVQPLNTLGLWLVDKVLPQQDLLVLNRISS